MRNQPSKRLIYQNWLVDAARNASSAGGEEFPCEVLIDKSGEKRRLLVERAVRAALSKLPEEERELIERVHFMGESFQSISSMTGRRIHKLEAMHHRGVRILRKALAEFVSTNLGIVAGKFPNCPLCNSRHRSEIDLLIAAKREEETWKEVIRIINERFSILLPISDSC